MLIEIALLLILNSLVIIGLHRAALYYVNPEDGTILQDSKGILWAVKFYTEKTFGEFYSKPLISCVSCMASVHSTYVYWAWVYFTGFEMFHVALYLMYIPALSGLNYIVNSKID